MRRIAVPFDAGRVCPHFGHAPQFLLFDVDPKTRDVVSEQVLDAPPHHPGLLPRWLASQGVQVILAGGMGGRARELFEGHGVEVVVGIGDDDPRQVVARYLEGRLATGVNPCDH